MTGGEQTNETEESLTLSDALKLSGLVDTGGHAKSLIQGGLVRVNGEIEKRRKRLVGHGDEIEVAGERFVVELLDDPAVED